MTRVQLDTVKPEEGARSGKSGQVNSAFYLRPESRPSIATRAYYCALFEIRVTNSSNLERRSFRTGDSFDFL